MKNEKQTDKHQALQMALARIDEPRKSKRNSARAVNLRKQEFRKSATRKLVEPTNPSYRLLFCDLDE